MQVSRKIVIAPAFKHDQTLEQVKLPNPRTGELSSYYMNTSEEAIFEAVKIDMNGSRSWLGEGWVVSDGSLVALTPIDPLYIYLALLSQSTISKEDEYRFVDVDSFYLESSRTIDAASMRHFLELETIKKRAITTLCESRDIGNGMSVARIDESKVLKWLKRKCSPARLPQCIADTIENAGMDKILTDDLKSRELVLLISEYISDHWSAKLAKEFGGFSKLIEHDKLVKEAEDSFQFDAPESYVQGMMSTGPKRVQPAPSEKSKSAKERQLEKAGRKSKPITSFFSKKKV